MNSKIYRQADSRWGKLPYPTKAYSFAGNGCGCCAVTHCAIEIEQFKNYTPATVRKFMVQFATKGNGTLWTGIYKGLTHYGYNVHWKQSDSMTDIYKVLKKSLKKGVILFGSNRGPDGTVWTTGGHYIAFTDYRIKDGQHQFYLKDSGGRKHDGWYTYEKSMRGDVKQVWICTSLKDGYKLLSSSSTKPTIKKITKPANKNYTGTIPTPILKKGNKGTRVKNLQKFLNWYGKFGLVVDGEFGDKTKGALQVFQKTEGLNPGGTYATHSYNKAKAYKKKVNKKLILDISSWQKNVDWAKVANNVDGVIIRASLTYETSGDLDEDNMFKSHIKGAKSQKLPIGAYHYSQAITITEAKKEAEFMCKILEPYKKSITLPVVFDWEFGKRLNANKAKSLGKDKCTAIVNAFCDVVKSHGYTPMIYANLSTFKGYLNVDELKKKYLIWLAQYNSIADMSYDYWQYTSTGKISGISGNVDLSKTTK